MRIAITGTPGTGKTKISKKLSEELGLDYISVNREALKGFVIESDKRRKTKVIDIKKLSKKLSKQSDCVLDGHLAHYCKPDFTVVLRTRPDVLHRRLKGRGWSKPKITENIQAEILGVISAETKGFELDTTGKTPKYAVGRIKNALKSKRKNKPIDWMRKYGRML